MITQNAPVVANELAITAAELGGNARTGGLTSSIYALWDMLELNPSVLSLTQKFAFCFWIQAVNEETPYRLHVLCARGMKILALYKAAKIKASPM